jgi:uncharacterized protein
VNLEINKNSTNHGLTFDVVLKVAERCNLACPYCYYFFQEYSPESRPAFMLPEVLEVLPRFLRKGCSELNISRLNVVFHGGEPLLFGKQQFDALCNEIRKEIEPNVELTFKIQTNGVLLDNEWIKLLIHHRVMIGISIDGSVEVHDNARPDHKGDGSYYRATNGLKCAQTLTRASGAPEPGVLAVIQPLPEEYKLLDHLINELGVSSPNLNFPRGGPLDPGASFFDSKVEWHRVLVKNYLERYVHPKFHYVRGISNVMMAIYSEKGALINDKRASIRHFILTIASNGDLLLDDNLLSVDLEANNQHLSLFSHTMRDFVKSQAFQELSLSIDYTPDDCSVCEWYRSCRSGDLFNRFSIDNRYKNKSSLCNTIKMIHEECAKYLLDNRVTTIDDLGDHLSKKPSYTGARAISELLERSS